MKIPLIDQALHFLTRWLNRVSVIGLIAAMVVVCINVIGRDFFQKPLKGTVDISSLLGALIVAGAIPHTQVLKGHIRISVLVEKLPAHIGPIVEGVVYLISSILFALISWQTILFSKSLFETGELSEVLKIPLGPFAAFVAAGCIAITLVLLIDMIKAFSKEACK